MDIGIKEREKNTRKKRSKTIGEFILMVIVTIVLFYILKMFDRNNSVGYLYSVATFIRVINGLVAIISIIICLILYKKTNDQIMFNLLLVYVSLTLTVILGQLDYSTFFNFKFIASNYISMTVSLLRIMILFSAIFPNSKLCKFINKHKKASFIFIVVYSIVFWKIEKVYFTGSFFANKSTLIFYNIFVFIAYFLTALRLFVISIRKDKVILRAFSISLLLIAIKSIYIIYSLGYNNFNMKLISALLTYIAFLTVIIGCVLEFHLLYVKSNGLNKELRKFYNLANFNSHTNIFICDKDLNISYMNNKIKERYTYDITSEMFKERVLKNKDVKGNLNNILEVLNKEGTWRGILKDNENNSIMDCFIQTIYSDENSDEDEILVSYIDITERIKLETELNFHKINDIKKTEFISVLSHELKTPLNIFYSTIQLLEKTRKVNEKQFSKVYDKYSNSLKVNSKRMLRLINNIVDTTRIDNGVFRGDFGNYEIVSLVEDIATSTVFFAESKSISVEFDTNVEEHYIKCDPTMIEKIVLNLLSNSIKYTKEGGIIKINIIVEEKWVKMIFEDTGIGIPVEMQDKIFDRFLRLDNSLRRLNEGSGIGLSIVKSMVEEHGGSISVSSTLNKGSIFEVKLPNVLLDNSPMNIYEFNETNTELELSDIYK